MTLGEVIEALDEFDDELTIYAARDPEWTQSSPAVVTHEPEGGGVPAAARGLDYFLEVDLAKEAIEVWSQWRGGVRPSANDRFEAVLYYAVYDAYLQM